MFKEVKTTRDGKCSKCGRNLKRGWTAYYDFDTKELLCQPCGTNEIGQSGNVDTPDNLKEQSNFDAILWKIDVLIGKVNEFDDKLNKIIENESRLIQAGIKPTSHKTETKSSPKKK